jgi:hypothetical protein
MHDTYIHHWSASDDMDNGNHAQTNLGLQTYNVNIRKVSMSWKKCAKWVAQDQTLSETFSHLDFINKDFKPLTILRLGDAHGRCSYTVGMCV